LIIVNNDYQLIHYIISKTVGQEPTVENKKPCLVFGFVIYNELLTKFLAVLSLNQSLHYSLHAQAGRAMAKTWFQKGWSSTFLPPP